VFDGTLDLRPRLGVVLLIGRPTMSVYFASMLSPATGGRSSLYGSTVSTWA
jgi:hypothetical protein